MSTLDDIRQRVQGARRASLLALQIPTEELESLLAAVDAVLALCVTSEEHAAQFGDVPAVYVDYIRAAVNDALEAGK